MKTNCKCHGELFLTALIAVVVLIGLAQFVFIILKIGEVIDWSWYWVFTPLYAEIAISAATYIVVGFIEEVW